VDFWTGSDYVFAVFSDAVGLVIAKMLWTGLSNFNIRTTLEQNCAESDFSQSGFNPVFQR